MRSTAVTALTEAALSFGCLSAASPVSAATEDELLHQSFSRPDAEGWQFMLSMPAPANPLTDTTGANCVSGQHGPLWFLVGAFFGVGKFTRTCTMPTGQWLYVRAVNCFFVDTPGVCGQGPASVPVAEMRQRLEACLNGVT